MVKFGPSGFCDEFVQKYSSTEDMPKWLKEHGLTAYELSFTNGVRLSDETAKKFGDLFKSENIDVSVHAPYFINFANKDALAIEKSNSYIIQSLNKMKLLGAKKLVFHPGSLMKMEREDAFLNVYNNIKNLIKILDENGFSDFILCPETMGKHGQVGTVEEIAKLCAIDERIMPTLDFGHINSFNGGSLKTEKDFEEVFNILKNHIGERFKDVHIHFSKIEYGKKGEIRHLTFEDSIYGPNFEFLSSAMKKLGINANIICESRGAQTKDAVIMKNIYNEY